MERSIGLLVVMGLAACGEVVHRDGGGGDEESGDGGAGACASCDPEAICDPAEDDPCSCPPGYAGGAAEAIPRRSRPRPVRSTLGLRAIAARDGLTAIGFAARASSGAGPATASSHVETTSVPTTTVPPRRGGASS